MITLAKASRDKGIRGEREVAAIFQTAGFDCNRVPNSGALRIKGDLYGKLPVHVEVKFAERWDIPGWLGQAKAEAPQGVTPVLCFRRSRGEWYAALPLSAYIEILAASESQAREEAGKPSNGYGVRERGGERSQAHPSPVAASSLGVHNA